MVFCGVVTLVNLKILWSTSNYTFFSYFLTIGSIFTFILAFYLVNLLTLGMTLDVYSQFQYVFLSPMSYLVLFFIGAGMSMLENGLTLIHKINDQF